MAQWFYVITFFDMPGRKVWNLLVGIYNTATWKSMKLLEKDFTISKYPISINILAHIVVTDIMPPIRVAISASMRGEKGWLYKILANFIFFDFTSAAATCSGPFRLILFTSIFTIFSLLRASAETSQLRSAIFLAGTLAEVVVDNSIEQWMMDGAWIEWIGV